MEAVHRIEDLQTISRDLSLRKSQITPGGSSEIIRESEKLRIMRELAKKISDPYHKDGGNILRDPNGFYVDSLGIKRDSLQTAS